MAASSTPGPLKALGRIQNLAGEAISLIQNDRNRNGPGDAVAKLREIFNLCVDVRSKPRARRAKAQV